MSLWLMLPQIWMLLQKSKKIPKPGCFTDILNLAVQKIYKISRAPRWTLKIIFTDSVSNQMWYMVTNTLSASELWHWITARQFFCRTLLCDSEVDLWPSGYKILPLYPDGQDKCCSPPEPVLFIVTVSIKDNTWKFIANQEQSRGRSCRKAYWLCASSNWV